jgi:hypothetical protein
MGVTVKRKTPKLDQLAAGLRPQTIGKVMEGVITLAIDKALDKVPVDTGRLHSTIAGDSDRNSLEAKAGGAGVDYWKYTKPNRWFPRRQKLVADIKKSFRAHTGLR